MLYPKKNRLFEFVFSIVTKFLFRKHFHKIHISGEENVIKLLNKFPLIFYLNHSCWWDPLVVFYLSTLRWKLNGYAVMDIIQLLKYKYFRRIGVFSIDRNNAREAIKSIAFASEILKYGNNALWIFPQGEMHPSNFRPIEFSNGLSAIIKNTQHLFAVPVTIQYEFIDEQRPEIFISISLPVEFKNEIRSKNEITAALRNILIEDLEQKKDMIAKGDLFGFQEIMIGKKSINK